MRETAGSSDAAYAELSVQVVELRAQIQRLADLEAIRERLDTYVSLLDSGRWAQIPEEIFTADGVDYHAPLEGDWASPRGHREIEEFFDSVPMFSGTQHLLGNARIEIDGDVASSRVYALFSHWVYGASESDLTAAIFYEDRWRRETVGWRIHERRVYACGEHGKVLGSMAGARLTPDSELYGPRPRNREGSK
jgi:hypothetical protein